MELEEKIRFAMGTIQPMAEHTYPFVRGVVGVEDAQNGKLFGSGFTCELDDRRLIVTAKHVIDEILADGRKPAFSAGYGVPPRLADPKDILVDETCDLAFYPVPPGYLHHAANSVSFWPAERIDTSWERLSHDFLIVHGFPGRRAYSSAQLGGIVAKSLPYGAMRRLEDLPEEIKPFQFAIHFEPASMRLETHEDSKEPIDPHGLSGCPVFRIGASGRSVDDWTPQSSLLVGMVTRWDHDSGVLIAVHAEKILESTVSLQLAGHTP